MIRPKKPHAHHRLPVSSLDAAPSPERKLALENVARQVKRIAVEREHERRNAEDLAFLEWVKEAPTPELAAQRPFAVSWQRVAIERELGRR